MKILTAAEMRDVDRRTIESGIPGLILMENAAGRVVDFLRRTFVPLYEYQVIVFCGKGNNGGDGLAIARQLFSRQLARSLQVYELFPPEDLKGDAALNRKMLRAGGCPVQRWKAPPNSPENRDRPLFEAFFEYRFEASKTVVVDAILGTGTTGAARGLALSAIQSINRDYPGAIKVSVDIPSGYPSDDTDAEGEFVKADYTVTFTAPKRSQVFSPSYQHMGHLLVLPIGSPAEFCDSNPNLKMNLTEPQDVFSLFSPRPRNSNKGLYGHVLVVGGSFGKSGAPTMTGLGSYRSGAGLVTVAVPKSALVPVAAARLELMTEPLEETGTGHIAFAEASKILKLLKNMTVLALGPGLGAEEETARLVHRLYIDAPIPAVLDADALNVLAKDFPEAPGPLRVLTPHPGEMGRLAGLSTKDVQSDRIGTAQQFAAKHGVVLVLKGDRTVIAFPDGETWINPTGSPSMATGGTGDILTGMIAGLLAQHTDDPKRAIVGAVWLHGRCGELASNRIGEQSTLALDLLDSLPAAIAETRKGDRPYF